MTVEELITEVMAVLQREGRISYRILKRRFTLDDEYLEDLKAELIKAEGVAADENGEVLIWIGNSSLESSVQKEAEECFWKAIEIARKQQAKSLELRAVMSLSRLWQQQGKQREAHQMLAEIYGWFTEGFDTKDLQEAKSLLAALGEAH